MMEVRAGTRSQFMLHTQLIRGVVTRWYREANSHHANYVHCALVYEQVQHLCRIRVWVIPAIPARKIRERLTHMLYERFGRESSFILVKTCRAKKFSTRKQLRKQTIYTSSGRHIGGRRLYCFARIPSLTNSVRLDKEKLIAVIYRLPLFDVSSED